MRPTALVTHPCSTHLHAFLSGEYDKHGRSFLERLIRAGEHPGPDHADPDPDAVHAGHAGRPAPLTDEEKNEKLSELRGIYRSLLKTDRSCKDFEEEEEEEEEEEGVVPDEEEGVGAPPTDSQNVTTYPRATAINPNAARVVLEYVKRANRALHETSVAVGKLFTAEAAAIKAAAQQQPSASPVPITALTQGLEISKFATAALANSLASTSSASLVRVFTHAHTNTHTHTPTLTLTHHTHTHTHTISGRRQSPQANERVRGLSCP